MSSSEVTRACDADRERFTEHLNRLYALGYIGQAEVEELRRRILDARSLNVLEASLYGLPQPETPKEAEGPRPDRDWGMPENFGPVSMAVAVTGILTAVVPVTALAHHGDALSNVLSAVSIIIGLSVALCAIIVAFVAACRWEEAGEAERKRRRDDRKRR